MIIHSILEGIYSDKQLEVETAENNLKGFKEDYNVEGFVKAIVANNVRDGLIQTYVCGCNNSGRCLGH